MAVPSGVDRYVVSGTMPGGEKWACGFYLPSGTGSAQDAADTAANVSSNINGMIQSVLLHATSGVVATRFTVYRYTGGSAASDTGTAAFNRPGQSSAAPLPNQTAFVTTLRSATAGRSGRGRIYWPLNGLSVGPDGLVSTSDAQAIVNAVYSVLGTGQGRVVSTKTTSAHVVTRVDADLVLDSQNGRRRSLSGTRVVGHA